MTQLSTGHTLTWNKVQKLVKHSDMLLAWPWYMRQRRQPIVRTVPLHMTFLLTRGTHNSRTLHRNNRYYSRISTEYTTLLLCMFALFHHSLYK